MLTLAVAIAVSSTVTGAVPAHPLQHEPGPLIVAVAAGVFFVGLLKRRP